MNGWLLNCWQMKGWYKMKKYRYTMLYANYADFVRMRGGAVYEQNGSS